MTTATIPSRTVPGAAYTVTLHDSGAASCSCPAGQHGRPCWHVKAVKLAAGERAAARRQDAEARMAAAFRP